MDLRNLLKMRKISQQELGRRLGYKSNGAVYGVISGRMYVPPEDAPRWADALGLECEERQQFLNWCAEAAIPQWYRDQLKAAELEVAQLRQEVAHLAAEIANLRSKRDDAIR